MRLTLSLLLLSLLAATAPGQWTTATPTAAPTPTFTPLPAGSIILVPTDYATIKEAVENSAPGDTVRVGPGEYQEGFLIPHALTIQGTRASDVILRCPGDGTYIRMGASNVTIENVFSRCLISPRTQSNITIQNCMISHSISFLGPNSTLDRCIILIPPPEDTGYEEPETSPGGSRAIGMSHGEDCVISNNLLLGVKQKGVGHFDGEQPPFVTPTPYACGAEYCEPQPWGTAHNMYGVYAQWNCRVVNNTIVNVRGGDSGYLRHYQLERQWAGIVPGDVQGIRFGRANDALVANNIIWNIQGGQALYRHYDGRTIPDGQAIGLWVNSFGENENGRFINNIFFGVAEPILVEDYGGYPTDGFRFENNWWASPGFVNSASLDMRLLPSSPAIDAGTAIPWLKEDVEGNPRPVNYGWDIGAFEYQELLADLNQDGRVDALDLGVFVEQWGMELPEVQTKSAAKRLITPVYTSETRTRPTPVLREAPAVRPTVLPVVGKEAKE